MRKLHWVVMALALALSVPHARASMVEALDLDALVSEADSVVLARVMKSWSHYDDHKRIVTDYQMQVEKVEKGDSVPGSAVVVRKLGGVVGDLGMTISGEPSYQDNELVLLFGKGGKSYLRPVGMGQGAMRITEAPNGERWVRSDSRGMSLVRKGSTDKSAAPAVAQPRKLDDVLAEVHALVTAQKK